MERWERGKQKSKIKKDELLTFWHSSRLPVPGIPWQRGCCLSSAGWSGIKVLIIVQSLVNLQLGDLEIKLLIIVRSLVNLQLGDLELKYYCSKSYFLDHLGQQNMRTLSFSLLLPNFNPVETDLCSFLLYVLYIIYLVNAFITFIFKDLWVFDDGFHIPWLRESLQGLLRATQRSQFLIIDFFKENLKTVF
jgi:hypothetical protein